MSTMNRLQAPLKRVRGSVVSHNITLIAAVATLTVILLASLLGPVLIPYGPLQQDLGNTLLPPGSASERGVHLLGTDDLGRDVLTRTLAGGRIPFLVGLGAVAISGTIGVFTGLCAGFFGGKTDAVLSRIADMQLSLPNILVALTLLAFVGQSVTMLIIVIAVIAHPPHSVQPSRPAARPTSRQ